MNGVRAVIWSLEGWMSAKEDLVEGLVVYTT